MSDDATVVLHFGPFTRDDLRAVRRFAVECGTVAALDPDRVEDVTMVVNEAVTNAVEHGGGQGVLRARFDGETLLIEVTSRAPGHDIPADPAPPDPGQARGRGLWIMRALSDRLEIRTGDVGTTVCMYLRRVAGVSDGGPDPARIARPG